MGCGLVFYRIGVAIQGPSGMAASTRTWCRSMVQIGLLTRRLSGVVMEEGWRFGFTMALPASHGLDGAAEFGWLSFKGVTLVWIDVGDGWLNGFGCGLVFCRIDVATQGTLFAPPAMVVLFWLGFCAFVFYYCLRIICHGWISCFFQATGLDQLVWVFADGDGPAVRVLLVNGCGSAGWRGYGFPSYSLLLFVLSASCSLYDYFFIVLICSCILFPVSDNLHGLKLNGFSPRCHTLCALSASERWRAIVKWLLPPSVRMKSRVLKLFYGFGWLYEDVKLLTRLLCLYGGCISSIGSNGLKTFRVAICALYVFRRKLVYLYFREILAIIVGLSLYVLCVLRFRLYVPLLYSNLSIVMV
jgi:hypothetical protein